MRLPKPIYEVYPVVVIVSGIIAIACADSFMMFTNGVLLAVTGTLILKLRNKNRNG